jgi:uncharacterized protein YcbK (DUF882 family)
MKDYQYFSAEELKCKCGECDGGEMNDAFMKKVERMRCKLGFSFVVTSGYRCPAYNASVSSTGLDGPHTTGRAIDIKAGSREKFLIKREAMLQGIIRFGVGKNFIHFDDLMPSDGFDPNVIWTY